MNVKVIQRTTITRYAGEYPSLSAFLLSASPTASDKEQSCHEGSGTFDQTEEGFSLRYREEDGAHFTAEQKDGILKITRAGASLGFCEGKTTSFLYRTAYGSIPTEAYTRRITLSTREGAYLLTLSYVAVLAGMAQENELRFKITRA